MPVSFAQIDVGAAYSRQKLAALWGSAGLQALARGVLTPRADTKIILFVTRDKQSDAEQYEDELAGDLLRWDGPTDHFAEDRMLNAAKSGDEIHLFYRERHHSDFTYFGQVTLDGYTTVLNAPSNFVFETAKSYTVAESAFVTRHI